MKRICVFCGSSLGKNPEYIEMARTMGETLCSNGIGLVYGGANVGLMGVIASTVLKKGGEIIGVIPRALAEKEVAFQQLKDLRVVDSMHERKALMAELSDGFIAMPGGFGTVEEFCEVLTWSQLAIHHKPVGLLNINHYFDPLLELFDRGVQEDFIKPQHRDLVLQSSDPQSLIDLFKKYAPAENDIQKWCDSLVKI